jgi:hypothetical protein
VGGPATVVIEDNDKIPGENWDDMKNVVVYLCNRTGNVNFRE